LVNEIVAPLLYILGVGHSITRILFFYFSSQRTVGSIAAEYAANAYCEKLEHLVYIYFLRMLSMQS
jgi:hypothetical protein